MSDKSHGLPVSRGGIKNPLLSNAVVGLTYEDLAQNTILLPVAENTSLTNQLDTQPAQIETKKTEDDFNVDEYFARLQSTRYVSAPINANLDQNANLDEEGTLEEINLNERVEEEVQQSITQDIAQNFSQLPTVLPQVASAVFSSFSNMLKNNWDSADGKTMSKMAEEPQKQIWTPSELNSEVGCENKMAASGPPPVGMMQPEAVVGPPPKEFASTNTFRMTSKKKSYAQVPGLSYQNTTYNPTQMNLPPNTGVNTIFTPIVTPSSNIDIGASQTQIYTPESNQNVTNTANLPTVPSPPSNIDVGISKAQIYTPEAFPHVGKSSRFGKKTQNSEDIHYVLSPPYIIEDTVTSKKQTYTPEPFHNVAKSYIHTSGTFTSQNSNLSASVGLSQNASVVSVGDAFTLESSTFMSGPYISQHPISSASVGSFQNPGSINVLTQETSAQGTNETSTVSSNVVPGYVSANVMCTSGPPTNAGSVSMPVSSQNDNVGLVNASIGSSFNAPGTNIFTPPPPQNVLSSSVNVSTPELSQNANMGVNAPMTMFNIGMPQSTLGHSATADLSSIPPVAFYTPPSQNANSGSIDAFLKPATQNETIPQNMDFAQNESTGPVNVPARNEPSEFNNRVQEAPILPPPTLFSNSTVSNVKLPPSLARRMLGAVKTDVQYTKQNLCMNVNQTFNVPQSTADLRTGENVTPSLFNVPQIAAASEELTRQNDSVQVAPSKSMEKTDKTVENPIKSLDTASQMSNIPQSCLVPDMTPQKPFDPIAFLQNVPKEEPKFVPEPPKIAAGNLRLNKKRPQYYSGPIDGVGSISNNVKPVIGGVDAGNFQGALFVPPTEVKESTNFASTAPTFDLTQPSNLNPVFDLNPPSNLNPSFDLTQSPNVTNFNSAFDLTQANMTSFNQPTEFDLSRKTTEEYEQKESKGFGLIGSLKSKLSAIDINKIQNTVTTFFDPAYNDNVQKDNVTQDYQSYQQQNIGHYPQDGNLQICVGKYQADMQNYPQSQQAQGIQYFEQNSPWDSQGGQNWGQSYIGYTPQPGIEPTTYPMQNTCTGFNQDVVSAPAQSYFDNINNENLIINQHISTDAQTTENRYYDNQVNNANLGIHQKVAVTQTNDQQETSKMFYDNLLSNDLVAPRNETDTNIGEVNTIVNVISKQGEEATLVTRTEEKTSNEDAKNEETKDPIAVLPEMQFQENLTVDVSGNFFDETPKIEFFNPQMNVGVPQEVFSANDKSKIENNEAIEANIPHLEENNDKNVDDKTPKIEHVVPQKMVPELQPENDEIQAKKPEAAPLQLFGTNYDNDSAKSFFDDVQNQFKSEKSDFAGSFFAESRETTAEPGNCSFFSKVQAPATFTEEKSILNDGATSEVKNDEFCGTQNENLTPFAQENANKIEKVEKDIDVTSQMIENITSRIQLLNPVGVPLPETEVTERVEFDINQCAEISHITEETIETIQLQSVTELLDEKVIENFETKQVNAFGWTASTIKDSYFTNPPDIGFKNVFFNDVPNASDEAKALLTSDILVRQMSIPTAPTIEEFDLDANTLDVNSIEQDATNFPVDEYVIEPETDDTKIKEEEQDNDTFANRVAKYQTEAIESVKTTQVADDFSTSPVTSMASYFDTGNFAADSHYMKAYSIPPSIHENKVEQITDIPINKEVLPKVEIPETETQTQQVVATTYSTADTFSNVQSMQPFLAFPDVVKDTKMCGDMLFEKQDIRQPDFFGTAKDEKNAKELKNDSIKTTIGIEASKVDNVADPPKLVDPLDFFSTDVKEEPTSNRLASYFSAPANTNQSQSFFENRQCSKKSEEISTGVRNPQNFKNNVDLMKDLTSLQHFQPSSEQLVKRVEYCTVEYNFSKLKTNLGCQKNELAAKYKMNLDANNNEPSYIEPKYVKGVSISRNELKDCKSRCVRNERSNLSDREQTCKPKYIYDEKGSLKSSNEVVINLECVNDKKKGSFKFHETEPVRYELKYVKGDEPIIKNSKCNVKSNDSCIRDTEAEINNIDFNNANSQLERNSKPLTNNSNDMNNNEPLCEEDKYVKEQRQFNVYGVDKDKKYLLENNDELTIETNYKNNNEPISDDEKLVNLQNNLEIDKIEVVANCDSCVGKIESDIKVRKAMDSTEASGKPDEMEKTEKTRKPSTVSFNLPVEDENEESFALNTENRQPSDYSPLKYHWFYREDKDGKSVWMGFSDSDSQALEEAYNDPDLDENTIVATDGGRYDVNIMGRLRLPVYWNDKPNNVRRCSWFYKGSTDSFVPYTEVVAEKLEEEYLKGVTLGVWHRRISLPNNEAVIMHGPSVLVHLTNAPSVDGWSGKQAVRPRVVRRNHCETEVAENEPKRVDHLLLMCHGVGSVCDMRFRALEDVVDDFRTSSSLLIQGHYKESFENGDVGRVEVLPISWHSSLHAGELGVDKRLEQITLQSIPLIRSFTNDTVLDVLFYTSPVYCQTIIDTVCKELNRVYALFVQRNPNFKGGVSLGGHSLGSVILYDLLGAQDPQKFQRSPSKVFCPGQAGTGQPIVNYPKLDFAPSAFYAMGSPIAIFECIRGVNHLGEDFRLPSCRNFFNIFHPYDPIAYRIEPLINSNLKDVQPVLIPHHKGRKRMHLELKETMTRVGMDLKQKLVESIKTTWCYVWRTQPPSNAQLEKVVEEEIAKKPLTDTKVDVVQEIDENLKPLLGKLNAGRRVDYVLQEAPLEKINEYLFAMSSHCCYWDSEDTMLLIIREIYDSMNIYPDASVPQASMTLERVRTSDTDISNSKQWEGGPSTSRN